MLNVNGLETFIVKNYMKYGKEAMLLRPNPLLKEKIDNHGEIETVSEFHNYYLTYRDENEEYTPRTIGAIHSAFSALSDTLQKTRSTMYDIMRGSNLLNAADDILDRIEEDIQKVYQEKTTEVDGWVLSREKNINEIRNLQWRFDQVFGKK